MADRTIAICSTDLRAKGTRCKRTEWGDCSEARPETSVRNHEGESKVRLSQQGDQHLKEASMCDYSLHCVISRSAKAADDLVTTSFAGTTTRGFAAINEPGVAVCLLP